MKSVEFGEPLDVPEEPEEMPDQVGHDEEEGNDEEPVEPSVEPDDSMYDPYNPDNAPSDPVDLGDWEPTLF